MKILYHNPTTTIKPYPRNDEDLIEGLSSDYLILTQVETTPPSITENQSLSFTYVVDLPTLEYRQQWTIIDNPPVANWDNFNLQMMSDPRFNQVYNQCLSVAPIVCASLPTALDQITSKDSLSLFNLVWNQLCQIGEATENDRMVWKELAIQNNLPEIFIDSL